MEEGAAMRTGLGIHIFIDMDETLLKGRYLDSFSSSSFKPHSLSMGSIIGKKIAAEKVWAKEWNEALVADIRKFKKEHPRSSFKGSPKSYKAYVRNLALETRVTERGWKVLWFSPDEAMAVYPRPNALKFVEEVSKLGTICVCSTASRDYAIAALGDALGVLHLFKDVATRNDIYPEGRENGAQQGWGWPKGLSFLLVDDMPPWSEAIDSKREFLGIGRNEKFSRHLINVESYEGWDPDDDELMKNILPEVKKRVKEMEDLCPNLKNTAQTA